MASAALAILNLGICLSTAAVATAQATEKPVHIELPDAPILPLWLETRVGQGQPAYVALTYSAVAPVLAFWTVDEGYPVQHLYPAAEMVSTNTEAENSSALTVPSGAAIETLTVHLVCSEPAYEIHLELAGPDQWSNGTDMVKPYTVYMPPGNEIGITAEGKSFFHVFLNATDSDFIFGAVAADLWTAGVNDSATSVQQESAYSFLPDDTSGGVRFSTAISTERIYHADVLLKSPNLAKNGGVFCLISNCKGVKGIMKRLSVKQTTQIQFDRKLPPIPENTVLFVKTGAPDKVRIKAEENLLIRCTAIGNPLPVVTLTRKSGKGKTVPMPRVLTFQTQHPFMTSAFFTVRNVRRVGREFTCRAASGTAVARKVNLISLLNG